MRELIILGKSQRKGTNVLPAWLGIESWGSLESLNDLGEISEQRPVLCLPVFLGYLQARKHAERLFPARHESGEFGGAEEGVLLYEPESGLVGRALYVVGGKTLRVSRPSRGEQKC